MGASLGRNSCTGGGGAGTTFSIDGGGVAGCDGGVEDLFLQSLEEINLSTIPSSLAPSFNHLSID
jgi:hypothetical protein